MLSSQDPSRQAACPSRRNLKRLRMIARYNVRIRCEDARDKPVCAIGSKNEDFKTHPRCASDAMRSAAHRQGHSGRDTQVRGLALMPATVGASFGSLTLRAYGAPSAPSPCAGYSLSSATFVSRSMTPRISRRRCPKGISPATSSICSISRHDSPSSCAGSGTIRYPSRYPSPTTWRYRWAAAEMRLARAGYRLTDVLRSIFPAR